MNSQVSRIYQACGAQATASASAPQAIALVMSYAGDIEPALALVSGVDRASLVHMWNEKWGEDRRKPDAPLGSPR